MADDINDKEEDGYLDSKDNDSEPVGNPAPPSDVDLDLLRGDRIGDTVYSGKWCIQTVMKMLQSNVTVKPDEGEQQQTEDGKLEVVDMEEELQNEVGVLWDMTSNVEVCQYLQSVGAIESIYHVIANSRCPRATEMCVGMLGNIITHDELWQSLQSDTTLFAILIPLFSSTDQPVLLELSRFFNTAMSHTEVGHCYASMCSNGPLITQELVRILSGSTNCDLLKQTTELTHILMCVDKDDSHFNALFADADFIAAVLEASKEIGYQQETSSQSCIMEILHGFTTYPAGISAMETCMGSITEAITKYLKSLCHNINLSNNSDIISVIITLLNHIFCRSLEVRIDLMSSSRLLQNILKILISLYRRLGLYDAIANIPQDEQHRHHHHHHRRHHHHHHQHHHHHHKKQKPVEGATKSVTASEPWESSTNAEEEEDGEEKSSRGRKAEPKSWSERAEQGEGTPKHVFATPDPSPRQTGMMKEVEFLSWSERRMASPLVDGVIVAATTAEDIWKIPQETRKMKKKTLSMEKVRDDDVTLSDRKEGSGEKEGDIGTETLEGTSASDVKAGFGEEENTQEDEVKPDSTSDSVNVGERQYELKLKGVEMNAARLSTDSHRSGGFSPRIGNDDDDDDDKGDESMECENGPDETEGCLVDGDAGKDGEEGRRVNGIRGHVEEITELDYGGRQLVGIGGAGAEGEEEEEEEDVLWVKDGARRDRQPTAHRSSNLDKYRTLLDVVREFLSDFFGNFREGLLTERGTPVIADIVSFLESQCRQSTLRIVVHCVGPSQEPTTPIGRLVRLASCLNADNLHAVLLDCVARKERQRI